LSSNAPDSRRESSPPSGRKSTHVTVRISGASSIHAASGEQTPAIRNDLDARPVDWLYEAAKVAAESVRVDYSEWVKLIPAAIAAVRGFFKLDEKSK
jgi:hypothetical protein